MEKLQNLILNRHSCYYVEIDFYGDRNKSWKASQEMTVVI